MTEEEWDRVISINLKGCFVCTLLVVRQMIKQKRGGKIINISSIAADTTYAGQLAYVASKGGVNSLTRAAAIDLANLLIGPDYHNPCNVSQDFFSCSMPIFAYVCHKITD